jgi:hypothetical protein
MSDLIIDINDISLSTSSVLVLDNQSEAEVISVEPLVQINDNQFVLSSKCYSNSNELVGDVPSWLIKAIQQELTTGDGNMSSIITSINDAMNALKIGITQSISSLNTASLSQSSILTGLRSDVNENNASILNVLATKVDAESATAIAVNALQSTFGVDASAFVANIASTYVDANSAIAQDMDLLTATINGVDASVSDIAMLTVENVTNPLWVDDGSQTDPDINGNSRYITQATAKKQLMVDADGVIAALILESGQTSSVTVQADQFKIIGSQDSSGSNPFDGVTGALTTEQQSYIDTSNLINSNGWSTDATAIAAQDTANIAQTTANTAQNVAINAQNAANTAQTNATTALSQLTDIASDNILSQVEKSAVIAMYSVVTTEQSGIDTQATSYGITTQKTNYDSAVSSLTSYLATLKTPVLWNDMSGNTTIVGTTFRSYFNNVATTRQTLLNSIYAAAQTAATNAQNAANNAQSTANSKVLPSGVADAINNNTTTINGSKITTGSISASQIAAGTLTVNNITSGTSYISEGSFALGGSASIAGYSSTVAFTSSTSSKWAMLASSTVGNAAAIATSQSATDHTGWACGIYNCKDSTFSSFNSTAYFCKSNIAATIMNGVSSKGADIGTSSYGVYLYGGAGPFTGAHDALFSNTEAVEVGDIIVDTGFSIHLSVSDCITSVTKSTTVNQKGVVGIYVAKTDIVPITLSEKEIDSETGSISYVINPKYETLLSEYNTICINSIGEGLVNVCGEGGNIEVGDAITTSSTPGKGMKQSDDIIHTYTVAKAREAVTFTDTTTSQMIACIYVAG